MHREKSKAVGKEPCPKCGSKDNLVRYEDGSAYCFTPDCSYMEHTGDAHIHKHKEVTKTMTSIKYEGEFLRIGGRKIESDQVKKYGVKTTEKGTMSFPYFDQDGSLVATKLRSTDKRFMYTGDSNNLELFGQSKFGNTGKYLTITEGELDAMAARQMLGDFPVVSIHSSTMAERDIKNNLEFIEGYDKIVLCMDNDEAGRKAVKTICEIVSPNKILIASLTDHKDACDYLMAGDTAKFKKGWWNAKEFTPVGVVSFDDAWNEYETSLSAVILPLPKVCGKLNEMLGGGIATGEITVIGANTSIGKTSFINATLYSMLQETDVYVGYLGFETTVAEVVKSMIRLQNSSALFSQEEGKKAFESITWKNRLKILNHQGSLALSEMLDKVYVLIKRYGLDVFLIDPIQLGLKDLSNDSVKEFMDGVLKLAKQTDCSFILVSHTRKPADDKPHSVSEYDLLGSSAINQVAFNTILLSRDKMSDEEEDRNTTHLKLVKCRRTGNTGQAGYLRYNKDTYHFTEVKDVEANKDEFDEFGE